MRVLTNSLWPISKNFACQDAHKTFSGRASYFVIIRGFLRYLGEKNYISAPNLDRCLLTGTAPVEKIVDVLSDEQIRRINEFCPNHRKAIELRDTAIVLLGLRIGFRASDVLNLHCYEENKNTDHAADASRCRKCNLCLYQ